MEKKKDEMMSYFKKYTFDKSKFKLGMRTFKTGIAVFLVLMIFGFFGFILVCFPQLIDWIAKTLGIASPVNMLFFLGFCFALMIIFVLTVAVSRASIRIKQLAQELALYEKRYAEEKEEKKDER